MIMIAVATQAQRSAPIMMPMNHVHEPGSWVAGRLSRLIAQPPFTLKYSVPNHLSTALVQPAQSQPDTTPHRHPDLPKEYSWIGRDGSSAIMMMLFFLNYNDEERITQAHLKYDCLPEVTIDISLVSSPWSRSTDKQQSFTGRKPVIPSDLADTSCDEYIIQGLLNQFNAILGTSYTLSTAGIRSILEHYISKEYDFGTAYAHDLSRREVQYQQMLEDVLITDRIIYPHVPPRRVWDLYSNRVVPWCIARRRPWAISHAWMDRCFRKDVSTAINDYEWPVPIPKYTSLDRIRIELLNLGAEYVWLDVLCLRQVDGRRIESEDLRAEEWKVDVPTIGSVYAGAEKVVCYLSGLGLPLDMQPDLSPNNWFKRAWTLQEISEHMILGGDTGDENTRLCAEREVIRLQRIRGRHRVYGLLSQMQKRRSTNPVDKVAAYCGTQSEENAWSSLVDVAAHQCQWDLLFLYPEPGDGTRIWRPSWRQAMSGTLPLRERHLNLQIRLLGSGW
ncbi:hypothetical protein F5146DRAFT_1199348 [Armillaria mellea]|nr:hypothetical protein F5146DRAFT_1199348 [Armillaria mellea]